MKHKLRARDLPPEYYDPRRRFRNAILCIMRTHPRPLDWIERNLPEDATECLHPCTLMMVEALARFLILRHYEFFHRAQIGWLLFRDWPLTDRGTLPPG